jgi:hypothetical protein
MHHVFLGRSCTAMFLHPYPILGQLVNMKKFNRQLLIEGKTTCYSISIAANLQEERLQRLKHRMKVYFDPSRRDHQVKFVP